MTDYVPSAILEAEADTEADRDRVVAKSDVVSFDTWRPLPHQWRAFQFVTDPDRPKLRKLAILGSYGSGKTMGATAAFLAACAAEPWDESWGEDDCPTSLLVCPTFRIARQSVVRELERVAPSGTIVKRRGAPYFDLRLRNGHLIQVLSAEGAVEGNSVCNVLIEECAHPSYDFNKFKNYENRARDPKAKKHTIIYSGLPSFHLQDWLDYEPSAERLLIMCATAMNMRLSVEVMSNLMSLAPEGADYLTKGGWQAAPSAVYPQFQPAIHVVNKEPRLDQPIVISFDVGSQGAVLFCEPESIEIKDLTGHTTREIGLFVFDEFLPDNMSVDEVCYKIKTDPKYADYFRPGIGAICIDATADRDELGSLRKHFPNAPIIKRERGDPLYQVRTGVNLVARGLRDSLGNTRLHFSAKMRGNKRGILDSLPKLRYRENSDFIIRDNTTDHVCDALRYAVCHMLPETRASALRVSYPGR